MIVDQESYERQERAANVAHAAMLRVKSESTSQQIIGPQDVARLTGLSRKKVRRLTLAGTIPYAYQLPSGIFRYHEGAVREWFASLSFPKFAK